MQSLNAAFFVGYSLWGGGDLGSGRALNLTVSLGSVGSDNLRYGLGSGFTLKPVQISTRAPFPLQELSLGTRD